jgi:hypothetical protein
MPLMNMKFMFTNRTTKPRQVPMMVTPMAISKLNSINAIINRPKSSCGSCGGGRDPLTPGYK